MHLKWALVALLATSYANLGSPEMKTLQFSSVQLPAPGEKFDRRHWLNSATLKRENRCPKKDDSKNAVQCVEPVALGLENRNTITDERFDASSEWSSDWAASEGRLNNGRAWSPKAKKPGEWIEVDLTEDTVVSGVITQGDPCPRGPWYVTRYKVAYRNLSVPISDYEYVTTATGEIQVFEGNYDRNTPVIRMFNQSILAARVRVEVVAWVGWPDLRFELLGCPAE